MSPTTASKSPSTAASPSAPRTSTSASGSGTLPLASVPPKFVTTTAAAGAMAGSSTMGPSIGGGSSSSNNNGAIVGASPSSSNPYVSRSPRQDLRREISTARLDLGQLPPRPAFDRETSFRLLRSGHDSPSRYYGSPSPAPSSSGMEMLLNAIEASPEPTYTQPSPSLPAASSGGVGPAAPATTSTLSHAAAVAAAATGPMLSLGMGLHRSSSAQSNSSQLGGMPSLKSITRALYPHGQVTPTGLGVSLEGSTTVTAQASPDTLHMPYPSPGGGQLSITSLLEASQQLASPPMRDTKTDWTKRTDPPALDVDTNLSSGPIGMTFPPKSEPTYSPSEFGMAGRLALPMGPYGMIGPYALPQTETVTGMKRKHEDATSAGDFGWSNPDFAAQEDQRRSISREARIRRALRNHSAMVRNQNVRINQRQSTSTVSKTTTIQCSYATVAQKSYGTEKRYLCPPPIISYSYAGASARDERHLPRFSMTIIGENGESSQSTEACLDKDSVAHFKSLHVTGSAKARTFKLNLSLYNTSQRNHQGHKGTRSRYADSRDDNDPTAALDLPLIASFDSGPITIISKPSKMTAKARNKSACIASGQSISLFNRINSQTVRTKYMCVEDGQLCAKNAGWSELGIELARKQGMDYDSQRSDREANGISPDNAAQFITYGSVVYLEDRPSGTRSDHLIIRKVEKNGVLTEATGPVSQMQKVAFQREAPDESGTTYYLSAASQNFSNAPAGETEDEAESGRGTMLTYQAPRIEIVRDANGNEMQVDVLDDYLSWSIVGIARFERSFVDTMAILDSSSTEPITPFPRIAACEKIKLETHTVTMVLGNLEGLYKAELGSQTQELELKDLTKVFEIWLGPIGPLHYEVSERAPDPALCLSNVRIVPDTIESTATLCIRLPSVNEVWQSIYGDDRVTGDSINDLNMAEAKSLDAITAQPLPATVDPQLALGPDRSKVETVSQRLGNGEESLIVDSRGAGTSLLPQSDQQVASIVDPGVLGQVSNANGRALHMEQNLEQYPTTRAPAELITAGDATSSLSETSYFNNLSATGRLNMTTQRGMGEERTVDDSINPADAFFSTSKSQRPPFIMPDLGDPRQSLPLMFVRADGIAYDSDWAVRCENAPLVPSGVLVDEALGARGGPLDEWRLQLYPL